jgi:hypothetical protein
MGFARPSGQLSAFADVFSKQTLIALVSLIRRSAVVHTAPARRQGHPSGWGLARPSLSNALKNGVAADLIPSWHTKPVLLIV